MKSLIFTAGLISALLFALPAGTAAQDITDLSGSQWQLISVAGTDVSETVTITLEFSDDEQAGGAGGCNTYGTTYTTDGSTITFGPVISTMMACADEVMAAEQSYFAALETASHYERVDDQLVITYADGQQLVFGPLVTLAGSAWQLVTLATEPVSGVITLLFDEEGHINGSGGCNHYGGDYSANMGAIYFEQVSMTLVACDDEAINTQELAYFAVLQTATRYEVSANQLVLTTADGQQLVYVQQITLENTQWQLAAHSGTAVLDTPAITLIFGAEEITGFSGCNTYRTTYTLNGPAISLSEISSTRMACLDEAGNTQEQAYLAALAGVSTYSLSGDQLILTGSTGEELIFIQVLNLVDTHWQLEALDGNTASTESSITLAFSNDERAAGSGGCNQYSASYSLDGESLRFGEITSTEMACQEAGLMEQEQAYLAALAAVTRYQLTDDRLILSTDDGQQLEFTALVVTSSSQ